MKLRLTPSALTALLLLAGFFAAVGFTGCDSSNASARILIDGSSTVLPISEAVAEEFMKADSTVDVSVGSSGTGGGFKKFLLSETDINDASRPIKGKEVDKASAASIDFIELPVAYDGIAVVVHEDNAFCDELSIEQLNKIWQPGSTVKTWKDVDASWPDERIKLFGPGVDSGTFDYFTETVNGKSQACRKDFTASEDDHVLVAGVAGEKTSLGFFGFAYYGANKEKLKLVKIKGNKGTVAPSKATIADGSYDPLSRPLFIYVRKSAADQPHVVKFVDYYLKNASTYALEVGYVGLPNSISALVEKRWQARTVGTMFSGSDQSLEKALSGK